MPEAGDGRDLIAIEAKVEPVKPSQICQDVEREPFLRFDLNSGSDARAKSIQLVLKLTAANLEIDKL